ncbi:MAG TPA: peptidase M48 [Betaproteobacteria bacterium]|nr:peptidase M48 [Betaproteobacteria bacterium]
MKRITPWILAAVLLSLPLSGSGFQLNLNKIGGILQKARQAGSEVSTAQEERIGAGIAANLLGAAPLVRDPALQRYVNDVGRWLTLHTSRPDLPWRFGVLDTGDINAFAAPGGYVFITRGLLLRLHSEAELAGVLAHEIAHVLKKHHLRAIEKNARMGILADVLHVAAQDNRHNESLQKVIGAGTELYARGLDKDDEYQADRMGVVIAARAGYDPFALPAVLQTLEKINPHDSAFALMFKTHPTAENRLRALNATMGERLDRYGRQTEGAARFVRHVHPR